MGKPPCSSVFHGKLLSRASFHSYCTPDIEKFIAFIFSDKVSTQNKCKCDGKFHVNKDIDRLAEFLGVEQYTLSVEMSEIPRKQANFVKNIKYGIMLGRLLTLICWVGVISILAYFVFPENVGLLLTGTLCLLAPRVFSGWI